MKIRGRRTSIVVGTSVYLFVWIPALLFAAIVTIAASGVFLRAPLWGAMSFLLALPAVLIGIRSFRASAITMAVLMVWDVVTTTWPHISFTGILTSPVDWGMLMSAALAAHVAFLSPFPSLLSYIRFLRNGAEKYPEGDDPSFTAR